MRRSLNRPLKSFARHFQLRQNCAFHAMPKSKQGKRNSAAQGAPYANAAAKTNAANSIFKMNKDVGQHVLKNPGIAQVGPVYTTVAFSAFLT